MRFKHGLTTASVLFCVTVAAGFATYAPSGGTTEQTNMIFPDTIVVSTILANNMGVLLGILLGSFLFASTTILLLGYNGLLIGTIMRDLIANGNAELIVYGILPHGVLEFGGFVIAGGVSFVVTGRAIHFIREDAVFLPSAVKTRLALWTVVSVTLVTTAAFVEVLVTPRFI